ncbi:MAG: hypothetical protein KatS3mg123_1281 [Burkholderiales bacterium]|nr:MAG: hypothetical protein KatS3mg123_1281 [Burkholderiales bacterium]
MIAVDTNVLARFLTNDDPAQAARALKLMKRGGIFIPKTVLLELEWVLRGGYKYDRQAILKAMEDLLGLPNVSAEDSVEVTEALKRYEAGLDFADALHLSSSAAAALRFATFDGKLAKRAKSLVGIDIRMI